MTNYKDTLLSEVFPHSQNEMPKELTIITLNVQKYILTGNNK